jgi:phenylacetate-coenzyme A ligase PaaK-like adenylate-forming protein
MAASTTPNTKPLPLEAFHRAAARVPAYRVLLTEAGLRPDEIKSPDDFTRLPVLEKRDTFQRFGIEQLCVDGELGRLGSVLTSSGHSRVFAFGLSDAETLSATAKWIDDLLDLLFAVRSQPTLLINCLPMGVKVHTHACTLAETSVRPDMAIGLVQAFGRHFAQIILVGETAFIKHVLELGLSAGVDWRSHRFQVIVGEEPLAENGRKYIEDILGIDVRRPETGIVFSSMGVAELGLNLFSEVPPVSPLILLRRALHEDRALRDAVLGPADWVPSLFTYDPRRVFVEFDAGGRLILTTLDPQLRLPLIRYATGDCGSVLRLPSHVRPAIESAGVAWGALESLPVVMINGRGQHALAGEMPVYPEAVKEGIYHDRELVPLTTANFRVVSGSEHARIRIQLSPGVSADAKIDERFSSAIARYVQAPVAVACEQYQSFASGMTLDYERKFDYLGR